MGLLDAVPSDLSCLQLPSCYIGHQCRTALQAFRSMEQKPTDMGDFQLSTDIWSLILRHIHDLKQHARASAICKASWLAPPVQTKLDIVELLPLNGTTIPFKNCPT